jgi:hypothetical protein
MCSTMEETRRDFTESIEQQYKDYCKLREIEPTIRGFSVYIVNRNLVTDLTINRFLVIDLYPHLLQKNLGIKQVTCWELEDHVGLKYASIRLILKRFQTHFRHKQRIVPKT